MKKTLIIILAFASLTGCESAIKNTYKETGDTRYIIINIDGCDYIKSAYRSDVPLIHKANCKNPFHKHENN